MHGTFDIRRDTDGKGALERYQVRYEDLAGNSFTGSMNSDELRQLLFDKLALALTDEDLDRNYDRLMREGHIVFPEIEMRPDELVGAGLTFLQAEG